MYKKTKHINKKLKNKWRNRKNRYYDYLTRLIRVLDKFGIKQDPTFKMHETTMLVKRQRYVERMIDVLSL